MRTFVFQSWIGKQQLLTVFMPLLLWLPGFAIAATKTVCDAGCDYTTIKAAHFNTGTGDTIFVRTAKVYNEFDLNLGAKTLVSDGGPSSFIINGAGCKNHVVSTGANGVVEGFTITGCVKDDGANGAGIVSNGNTELNNVIAEDFPARVPWPD